MRACATCGAPKSAHTYVPISVQEALAIQQSAPTRAMGRARVRGAMRRCPLVHVRDDSGVPVYRREREPVADVERRAA